MSSAPACQRATPRGKAWWTSCTSEGTLRRKRTTSAASAVASQATSRVAPRSPSRPRLQPRIGERRARGAEGIAPEPAEVEQVVPQVRPEEAPVRVGRVGREGHRGLRQLHRAGAVVAGRADPRAPEERQAHRFEIGDGQRLAQLGQPLARGPGGLRVARALRLPPGVEGLEDGVVALGRDEQRRRRRAVTGRGGGGGRGRCRRSGSRAGRCRARAAHRRRRARGQVPGLCVLRVSSSHGASRPAAGRTGLAAGPDRTLGRTVRGELLHRARRLDLRRSGRRGQEHEGGEERGDRAEGEHRRRVQP